MWAAAGVHVDKPCPGLDCVFQHQQGGAVPMEGDAAPDAIVVESVNVPKFGVQGGFQWPWHGKEDEMLERRPGKGQDGRPVLGMFYMEPEGAYPGHTLRSPEMRKRFDFSAAAPQEATIPVSLMCPWGQPPASDAAVATYGPLAAPYLSPVVPGDKSPGRGIAMFSDRGVHGTAMKGLREFMAAAKADGMEGLVHAYTGPVKNTGAPPGP